MCRKICRKKIAVLDLTHGGIPIAKKLSALGNEVFGADVYGTVAPEALLELEEKHGIRCSKTPVPVEGFDLIVSPVHLDPASPMLAEARTLGKKVLSHHEIVGEILKGDPRLSGIRTVEVTGVKAKTSTASLLADMLSREYAVVLHTSRGLEAWGGGVPTLIRKGLSITPGSVLSAVDAAFSAGRKPGFFIFEISIGGTGTADLGILTTLAPDYGIANSTSLASEAKLQLVRNAKPGSTLLLNACAKNALEAVKGVRTNVLNVLTFRDPFISGPAGKDPVPADFVLETENETASPESPGPSASSGPSLRFIRRGQEIFSASLRPGYNISAYRTAFVAASAAALELGAGVRSLVAALEGFGGLAGRMQEKELAGITLIDNSNSGMDIRSAEKALEYALLKKKDEKKGGILLVLGEEAAQVCEGLPPESVQGFVEKYGIKCRHIVLVGERMQAVKAKNASYEPSLPEGLSKASELAGPEDIIISSVKCFR